MEHIETIELTSSQSSITFSSIPQDYDDLVLFSSARTDRSQTVDFIVLQPNGNSANGSTINLGAATTSGVFTETLSVAAAGNTTASQATSSTFGNASCYISNYSSAQPKSISLDTTSENNGGLQVMIITSSLWNNTSAITSFVLLSLNAANFVSGSIFSLYGVTAGGSGTVTTS